MECLEKQKNFDSATIRNTLYELWKEANRNHFLAGNWCISDDGDEEIIELRSSDSGPYREHLAQASSSTSSTAPTFVQKYPHAHASYTLPLTPPQSQSQSYAQTSTSPEAETRLFRHHCGSRFVITNNIFYYI